MPDSKPIDLYKLHKSEYAAPKTPKLVDIGPAQYLSFTGSGAPGGEGFQTAVGALYGAAYTIKMTRKHKKGVGPDYKICKLEGIYWGPKDEADFSGVDPEQWNWQLIIRTPDFISQDDLDQAIKALKGKGKDPAVRAVTLATVGEGRCVQMLHVGSYASEGETMAKMAEFAEANGVAFHGHHHEIYLSDPRRVAEEKLRTILRMPVR
jgi:hypothetical protein